jgi:hypothetical protein
MKHTAKQFSNLWGEGDEAVKEMRKEAKKYNLDKK